MLVVTISVAVGLGVGQGLDDGSWYLSGGRDMDIPGNVDGDLFFDLIWHVKLDLALGGYRNLHGVWHLLGGPDVHVHLSHGCLRTSDGPMFNCFVGHLDGDFFVDGVRPQNLDGLRYCLGLVDHDGCGDGVGYLHLDHLFDLLDDIWHTVNLIVLRLGHHFFNGVCDFFWYLDLNTSRNGHLDLMGHRSGLYT